MQMDTSPPGGLRLMERAGRGLGYAAGGVALALLWVFEVTTSARGAMGRRASGPPPSGTAG